MSAYVTKQNMIIVFRSIREACNAMNKQTVSLDRVLRFVNQYNPELTLEQVANLTYKLNRISYVRFTDYKNKRYFAISKLGEQRWEAYVGANLMEIDESIARSDAGNDTSNDTQSAQ